MSDDLGGNLINNLSDLSTKHSQQGFEVSPIVARRRGWITLTVAHSDYHADDCLIETHIRRRTIEGERADLCAIFDFPAAGKKGVIPFAHDEPAKIHAELSAKRAMGYHGEQFVFVPIGEFPQDAQQRGQIGVWSVVRLIPLNDCPHWIANNSELFTANDSIVKVRMIIGDGELEPAFVAGRFRKRFVAGYRIYEMIEAATKGLNAVGNHQGPPIERRLLIDPNNEAVSGAVGVHVLQDAVRISFHPGRDFIPDGLSMFRAVS